MRVSTLRYSVMVYLAAEAGLLGDTPGSCHDWPLDRSLSEHVSLGFHVLPRAALHGRPFFVLAAAARRGAAFDLVVAAVRVPEVAPATKCLCVIEQMCRWNV